MRYQGSKLKTVDQPFITTELLWKDDTVWRNGQEVNEVALEGHHSDPHLVHWWNAGLIGHNFARKFNGVYWDGGVGDIPYNNQSPETFIEYLKNKEGFKRLGFAPPREILGVELTKQERNEIEGIFGKSLRKITDAFRRDD